MWPRYLYKKLIICIQYSSAINTVPHHILLNIIQCFSNMIIGNCLQPWQSKGPWLFIQSIIEWNLIGFSAFPTGRHLMVVCFSCNGWQPARTNSSLGRILTDLYWAFALKANWVSNHTQSAYSSKPLSENIIISILMSRTTIC